MMRFIVDLDDVFLRPQLATNAAHHFVRQFREADFSRALLDDLLGKFPRFDTFPWSEGMEVGDDDLGLLQRLEQFWWKNITLAIVILWVMDSRTRRRSRMLVPGVTIRKVSEKQASGCDSTRSWRG